MSRILLEVSVERSHTPVMTDCSENTATMDTKTGRFDRSSTIPLWLNGKQIIASSTFDVVSPLTQSKLYSCSSASSEDVKAAVCAAKNAFKSWSLTKPNERRDIFLKAAEIFVRRRDELWQYSFNETGAPESMFAFEHNLAATACKEVAGLISSIQGSVPTVAEADRSAVVIWEPYGVVLGIAPWNAPYVLGLRACLLPLAMGNTVILKGSESAPGVSWALASILHEAGLPAGALNTIYHRPSEASQITTALISDPAIKKINFTGSTGVGSILASLAGKYLKPIVLELGGKAPAIVCEDADVSLAAFQCVLGAFLHGGQICMATERIMVHRKIAEEFRSSLMTAITKMFPHDGKPLSQLINSAAVMKNQNLVSDAVEKGASLLYGEIQNKVELTSRMGPIILENVRDDMDIYHIESFGPTVSLYVVESDEDAVKLANDTPYGLSSAVFSEDLRRALKIAKQIEAGAVHINSMSIHDEAILPHGGAKESGYGRFNGTAGMEEWVRSKTITWVD